MAEKGKKKGVKGKGKKKGAKGKKKPALSNLERETFLLAIEGLENKMKWRREMRALIEKDTKLCEGALPGERRDKANAIHCLEKEILNQSGTRERLESVIAENEEQKSKTKDTRFHELAMEVVRTNREKVSYSSQLYDIKQTLNVLEMHDEDKMNEKISEIESQVNAVNEGELLKETAMDKRRENSFQTEVLEIFNEKITDHQSLLKESVDPTDLKTAEETRWFEDSATILGTMRMRLEKENHEKTAQLLKRKENTTRREEAALKVSVGLRRIKSKILGLEKHNLELSEIAEGKSRVKEKYKRLASFKENAEERLQAQKENLEASIRILKLNEMHLKVLESQFTKTNRFGQFLTEAKERAGNIIQAEVEYSLIKTYNGPPVQKNVTQELVRVLDDVTGHIYEQLTI